VLREQSVAEGRYPAVSAVIEDGAYHEGGGRPSRAT
jgi:hypothetical protein